MNIDCTNLPLTLKKQFKSIQSLINTLTSIPNLLGPLKKFALIFKTL